MAPSGCAGGRRFLATANASLCRASQIFCWHQCVELWIIWVIYNKHLKISWLKTMLVLQLFYHQL